MRGFIIVWLAAFGIVTIISSGVTWYVARNSPPPGTPISPAAMRVSNTPTPAQPFEPADAVDVVLRRLPTDAAGEQLRQRMQTSSSVSYYSPQHWRVCVDDACWIAHGPGRYAEPDNEAARRHEGATVSPNR